MWQASTHVDQRNNRSPLVSETAAHTDNTATRGIRHCNARKLERCKPVPLRWAQHLRDMRDSAAAPPRRLRWLFANYSDFNAQLRRHMDGTTPNCRRRTMGHKARWRLRSDKLPKTVHSALQSSTTAPRVNRKKEQEQKIKTSSIPFLALRAASRSRSRRWTQTRAPSICGYNVGTSGQLRTNVQAGTDQRRATILAFH